MPRLFLAIPLPDEVKDRLVALRLPPLSGMRLVGRAAMHVTLHFLGEVASPEAGVMQKALTKVKQNAFSLGLRGVGRFPLSGVPRVLWAGVERSPELHELHQSIGALLTEAIGFQPEKRAYAPHVTLARLNDRAASDAIESFLEKYKAFEVPPIRVKQFTLFSSVVVDRAPQYWEVAVFPLVGPGSAGR